MTQTSIGKSSIYFMVTEAVIFFPGPVGSVFLLGGFPPNRTIGVNLAIFPRHFRRNCLWMPPLRG